MPKSKHRRKPSGKTVANPGRGKPGKPLTLDHLRPAPAQVAKAERVVGVDDLRNAARVDLAKHQRTTPVLS